MIQTRSMKRKRDGKSGSSSYSHPPDMQQTMVMKARGQQKTLQAIARGYALFKVNLQLFRWKLLLQLQRA